MTSGASPRVLITGGAGFIGANLARVLDQDDAVAEVRVIDDLSSGSKDNLTGIAAELVHASILDVDRLAEAVDGMTHVVHLAAVPSVPRSIEDPVRSHEANATGTLRVLEASRRAGQVHVTLASSSSVYGSNPVIPKTEDLQCRPMSPYAVSKLAAEQYAMAYAQCYGMQVMPFRFFNVFGPLQPAGHAYAAVIPSFLEAALSGRPLTIHGDGEQTRDFTFVGDVVAVLRETVLRSAVGPPTNLAYGTQTSLLQVVDLLRTLLDRPVTTTHIGGRVGDVRDSRASGAQLRQLFPGLEPLSLVQGLRETAHWFESRRRP